MIIRTLLAATLAASLLVPAANALTLTNSDKDARMITIIPKSGKHYHVMLRGHHSTHFSCAKGCELAYGKSRAKFNAKTERVWIKKGKFVTA